MILRLCVWRQVCNSCFAPFQMSKSVIVTTNSLSYELNCSVACTMLIQFCVVCMFDFW